MTVQDTPTVVTDVPTSTAPIAQPDRSVTPGPTLAARQESFRNCVVL